MTEHNDPTYFVPGAGTAAMPSAPGSAYGDRLSLLDMQQHGLTQIWRRLWRRKWIAIAVMVAAVAGAMLFTLTQPNLYRATATIEISRESARVLNQEDTETGAMATSNEFYQTQYGLLRSRTLLERVVRELRIADNEAFLTGSTGNEALATASRGEREEAAVGLLFNSIEIVPTRNSGLVDIAVSSPDPELSAQIANALARNFVQANLERRFSANEYARDFLETELAKARDRLEESERNVVNYAAQRQIIELNRRVSEQGDTIAGQSLAEMDLDILSRRLAEARAERIAAEARLSAARRAGANDAAALADPALQTIRTRRAELQAEYARQLATLGPEYPTMIALREQIGTLDQAISRQSSGVARGLQAAFEAARSTEQQLQARVSGLRGDVTDLGRDRIQYNIYQREADTNRALYDSLLERYKEIGVAGGVGSNNVAIVDPALPPGGPYTPQPLLNLLLALLIGGLAGAGLAILVDQLDDAIRDPSDVEQLGTPLIGVIPRVDDDDRVSQLDDPKSELAEAFMAASASLRFATNHGVPRSIVFTSANPNEGKSTASLATGVVLSRLNKKVLLIDADMRNPSLHKLIDYRNGNGLSHVLSGEMAAEDVIQPSRWQNLDVITAGALPPNPGELLGEDNLSRLLSRFGAKYDHILFDAPPVIGLVDAPSIATATESTIFVVGANQTKSRSAVVSLRRLVAVKANVLGVLLTKFHAADSGYGYNYEYKYSG